MKHTAPVHQKAATWTCACQIAWTSPNKACPLCGNTMLTMIEAQAIARRAERERSPR